jgi:drug/metabolite transporter (DMT)-like permease
MWIVYSLLTAFSLATSDALTKMALSSRDEYHVAWMRLLFAMPLLLVSLLFIEMPQLDSTFWMAVCAALPLEIIALILYTKALKVSPISLSVPFLALTPVFLIVTSALIVGESISTQGMAGIILMAAGSYSMNLHRVTEDLFAPIRAIWRERGSVMMIAVAFIYSFTSALGKLAIEHSSPIFFGAFYFFLLTIFFTPVAIVKNRAALHFRRRDLKVLMPLGFTYGLMIIFHMVAMSMAPVAYMISIKRTSLLFSMIYGFILFREGRIAQKSAGALLMMAGFVLIILA